MNTDKKNTVFIAFIKSMRTRLWLETTVHYSLKSLWAAAVLLLTFGFIHILWGSFSGWLTFIITLSPLFIALIFIIKSHPTLALAAKIADRRFATRALFCSALDIINNSSRSTLSPAQALVLDQAIHTSAQCHQRLKYQNHAFTALPRSSPLLMAILIGGFFLLLQAKNLRQTIALENILNSDLATEDTTAESVTSEKEGHPDASRDFVLQLRQSLKTDADNLISKNISTNNLNSNSNSDKMLSHTDHHNTIKNSQFKDIDSGRKSLGMTTGKKTRGQLAGTVSATNNNNTLPKDKIHTTNVGQLIELKIKNSQNSNTNNNANSNNSSVDLSDFSFPGSADKSSSRSIFSTTINQSDYYAHLTPEANHYIARYFQALNANNKSSTGGKQP